MNHSELAGEYFSKGYNCAQSVLMAFSDLTGLEPELAAKLASSFGGGLGRMREVCGAVSGGAMVLGILRGYSDPENREDKSRHYRLVQDFAEKFKEENGSIICRELLSGVKVREGREPEERTADYYKKRPCRELVMRSAQILDSILLD